jgi:hypothetical protein
MAYLPQTRILCLLLTLLVFASRPVVTESTEEPAKVTPCQLGKDPAAYNHKLIQVTGFVSHGFEDFTFFDPACASWPRVWLEYGGVAASGTMYCCGVTTAHNRPKQLVIENIPIPLVDDNHFRKFDKTLQQRYDTVVRATLIGRFFSGKQAKYPAGTFWEGFGHMGCCSLFAIQQVVSVEPHNRNNLDYGASADQPELGKTGCTSYRHLLTIRASGGLIEAQKQAELNEQAWGFNDPARVAVETLALLLSINKQAIVNMTQVRKAQGRFVYQWHPKGKQETYMIVVSRPYWLSFYAKDKQKVAWVPIAAYESSCGHRNSVNRVH